MSKVKSSNGYFAVHRSMLDHWLFKDRPEEVYNWMKFARECEFGETEIIGEFSKNIINLKPNQFVSSFEKLMTLWGVKGKPTTKSKVETRLKNWKEQGLITWKDCECRTDGRIFTVLKCQPSRPESETESETKSEDTIYKNKNKNIYSNIGGKVPLTRENALAYVQEKIDDPEATYTDGVNKVQIVDEFLNWVEAGGETKVWKNTLITFVRRAKKYEKPNNFTYSGSGWNKGYGSNKGIDALRQIDREASKKVA